MAAFDVYASKVIYSDVHDDITTFWLVEEVHRECIKNDVLADGRYCVTKGTKERKIFRVSDTRTQGGGMEKNTKKEMKTEESIKAYFWHPNIFKEKKLESESKSSAIIDCVKIFFFFFGGGGKDKGKRWTEDRRRK